MRKLILLLFACTFSFVTNAQFAGKSFFENNSYIEHSNQTIESSTKYGTWNHDLDYKQSKEWKKYRKLMAAGWTTFSVGIPVTLTGLCIASLFQNISGSPGFGVHVTVIGGLLTASSIPLLSCAYYNRSKAMKLKASLSAIEITNHSNFEMDYAPAISLSLNF